MSQNNAISPLSRPPSTQANTSSFDAAAAEPATVTDDGDAHSVHSQQSVGGRVHDHNRPFPPPRLPGVHVVATPSNPRGLVTAAPPIGPATTTTTTTTITATATTTITTSSTFRSRPRNVDATAATATATMDPPAGGGGGGGRGGAGAGGAQVSNDTPPRSPIGEVSLAVPRPDGERAINEYVEAPFKQGNQERRFDDDGKRAADCPKIDRRHRQKGVADASVAATHRLHASRTPAFRGSNASSGTNAAASTGSIATTVTTGSTNAVTKQPVSFTKEPANSLSSRSYDPAGLSIMCNFCGRCRCESCREPPPLPSKWLCDNKCFCSADTILDYASCLCCVKGLFYHCADGSTASGIDGEAGGSCADEPCSCTGDKRASRWACLGALTLVMPCLLCYWPFRGCVQLCEMCYARHAAQGCRCNPGTIGNAGGRHHPIANDIGDSRDPEKRLLDPVTPEL